MYHCPLSTAAGWFFFLKDDQWSKYDTSSHCGFIYTSSATYMIEYLSMRGLAICIYFLEKWLLKFFFAHFKFEVFAFLLLHCRLQLLFIYVCVCARTLHTILFSSDWQVFSSIPYVYLFFFYSLHIILWCPKMFSFYKVDLI